MTETDHELGVIAAAAARPVTGSGVAELRAARTAIHAMTARAPVSRAIPAAVSQRLAILFAADGQPHPRLVPALVPSAANLREPDRSASSLAMVARAADDTRRRREEIQFLLDRLEAGRATASERLRLRHLAMRALTDVEGLPSPPVVDSPTPVDNPAEPGATVAAEHASAPGPQVGTEAALGAAVRRVEDLLGASAVPGAALHLSPFRVAETAVHDFAQYVFLRDPNLLGLASSGPDGADLDQFLQQAWDIIVAVVETYANAMSGADVPSPPPNPAPYFPQFEATIFQLFLRFAAADLYELSRRLQPGYDGSSGSTRLDVLIAFEIWLIELVQSSQYDPNSMESSFDHPQRWTKVVQQVKALFFNQFQGARLTTTVDRIDENYSFTPFPIGSVNFGLRLVFRQEWRPLGTQPGEIVRTIPLGPKQVERVSTKVVVNQRETRTAETFVSTETSTEASSVTRESSDVVEEASRSLKWHVDAEASASWGFGSARLSTGVAGETASSSKDSKSRLNETMQKTASRMRRDVKVMVSTERTITEEATQASEIVNPNDEVAVTYVYSKLQRQYEIQTRLAEVQSVVFVPERIPAWNEIDDDWVRRHDWIIGRALLDQSFAEDLAEIAREPEEIDLADTGDIIAGSASHARDAISTYKDFKGGGALPDLFSAVQGEYEKHLERQRGLALNRARRKQRSARLLRHLRENILHYMRAIWSAEDADQRLNRHGRMVVPTRWTFNPTGIPDPLHPELEVEGEFLPDLSPKSLRPLGEVLNPAGPVGYTGNYAVYYLKSDPRLVDLNQALTLLRSQYVRFAVTVFPLQQASPVVVQAFALTPRHRDATYTLERRGHGWTAADDRTGMAVPATAWLGPTGVDFDGIRVRFDTVPPIGHRFSVRLLATDELEDPELRALRALHVLPSAKDADEFFSPALLRDLGSYLPEVAALLPPDLSGGWNSLTPAVQAEVCRNYHVFLLLKEHTRRFLLETNNLLLDLEVGQTPGLEMFKRLHRVIDVLKEAEEVTRRTLENERRSRRLVAGDLADPEIESVAAIGTAGELRGLVGPVVMTTPGVPAPVVPGGGDQ